MFPEAGGWRAVVPLLLLSMLLVAVTGALGWTGAQGLTGALGWRRR